MDERDVRGRYGMLAKAYRRKIREEERASGISTPEFTEVEQAPEDLIVREDEADRDQQETTAQKRKVKEDTKYAEKVRKRAMERLGDKIFCTSLHHYIKNEYIKVKCFAKRRKRD